VAQLVIIGTHQRICPVAVRERLAFGAANILPALQALRDYTDEGFIVSTCNRVEVGGLVAGAGCEQELLRFLADCHHVAVEEMAPHLYINRTYAIHRFLRSAALVAGDHTQQNRVHEAVEPRLERRRLGQVGRLGDARQRHG